LIIDNARNEQYKTPNLLGMNDTRIPELSFDYDLHSNRKKKRMSTKDKIKRPTSVKKKEAWNGLYLIADNALNKFKKSFQKVLR
jgi:hypothetical protein